LILPILSALKFPQNARKTIQVYLDCAIVVTLYNLYKREIIGFCSITICGIIITNDFMQNRMSTMEKIFETKNVKQTEKLGASLGNLLSEGDFLALTGDLGAGKTAFTRGIARVLGIKDSVTSPTFTIINEYHDPVAFAHMDAYRLKSLEELQNIGFDDYLQGFIVVMEWADKVKEMLPTDVLWIDFTVLEDGRRRIRFTSDSPHYDEMIGELSI
jgi:tRNA threonylcarbamoyladenosine biosynthesis protein TsaE